MYEMEWVATDGKLGMAWQCAVPAQKGKPTLGCVQSRVGSRVRELILPPALSWWEPTCSVHPALGSQHSKDWDLLVPVQRGSGRRSGAWNTSPTKTE